jgi:hypothetical protein
MKKELKFIFIYLLWISILYFTMSFYKLTFDISLWNGENRFMLILLSFAGLLFAIMGYSDSEIKE